MRLGISNLFRDSKLLWKWLFEHDGDDGYRKVNYYSFHLAIGFWNIVVTIKELTYRLLVAKSKKQISI